MSEEGGFIDVESDEVPDVGGEATARTSNNGDSLMEEFSTDKRAHHNLLERRRRDHIKDSFHGLRDCIPSLHGEKVSRAHILNKATEYIRQMQRGGSMRESPLPLQSEISELKKKNEILEEQARALEQHNVHSIEQNKTVGTNQKVEEILETVARQVQQKQKQKDTQHDKSSQGSSKSEKANLDLSNRDNSRSVAMATRGVPTTIGSGSNSKKVENTLPTNSSSALSLLHLAGNLKNAQALLTALQKNLPPNATLASVKSLASKTLASSGARQGAGTASSSLPRGIVTATTVPKGSALPLNLASALQQKPTTPVLVGKHSSTASPNTSQIKPTISQTQTQQQTNNSGAATTSKTGLTSTSTGSTGQTGLTSTAQTGSTGQTTEDNTSQHSIAVANAATQLLEASSLLQKQGGGGEGDSNVASGNNIPSLTAEIIAQCFLNIPSGNSSASVMSGSGEDGEGGVAMTTSEATVSAANVLAALGSLTQDTSNHLSTQSLSSTPHTSPLTSSSPPPPHTAPTGQPAQGTNPKTTPTSEATHTFPEATPPSKRAKLEPSH